MRPQLLKVSNETVHSFSVRCDNIPNINNNWHYHPEIELIYFHKGAGTQFIGDNVKRFSAGDMVMVGKNLPHYWRYDDNCCDLSIDISSPYSTVIHFFEDFWSDRFLNLPENKLIKATLENASRGLQIDGTAKARIERLMHEVISTEGPKRIILLLEVLIEIGNSSQAKPLSSMGFSPVLADADKDRINLIYDYSFANFKNKILLDEIAGISNLSSNAFCRYFKSKTRKTYSQFINELRVGHACKLLIENKIPIKQICFESGFNNFSSFHTFFKSITGKSPLCYQKEFFNKSD